LIDFLVIPNAFIISPPLKLQINIYTKNTTLRFLLI
jgi:hypothetical protein